MTERQNPSGLVAELLNERELAINIGSEAGVLEGMKFKVLEPAREIKDPITQETLGVLQREKVKVKAIEVHRKYCIARTYETYSTGLGSSFAMLRAFSAVARATEGEVRVRTLKAQDKPPAFSQIAEDQSYVKVGDPVVFFEPPDPATGAEKRPDPPIEQILLSGSHRYVFAPKVGRAKKVAFAKGGELTEGRNDNESRWRIEGDRVEILASDGSVFNRFKYNAASKRFESTDDADAKAVQQGSAGQFFHPDLP